MEHAVTLVPHDDPEKGHFAHFDPDHCPICRALAVELGIPLRRRVRRFRPVAKKRRRRRERRAWRWATLRRRRASGWP